MHWYAWASYGMCVVVRCCVAHLHARVHLHFTAQPSQPRGLHATQHGTQVWAILQPHSPMHRLFRMGNGLYIAFVLSNLCQALANAVRRDSQQHVLPGIAAY